MPFNLMVQDRSGENLARGIDSLGRGVGGFLEGLAAHREKQKEEAGIATSLRTTLKKLDADNAPKYDVMGVHELKGAFQAIGVEGAMAERQQHQQLVAEQIKRMQAEGLKMQADSEQQARAPGFYSTLAALSEGRPSNAEMGDYFENGDGSMPAPTGRRMSPVAAIARSAAESGFLPNQGSFDDIIRAMGASQPKAPRGLPLGQTHRVDGVGTIVGTGEEFEPNIVQDRAEKDEKPTAANYPWLMSDDAEAFKRGLRGVTDPMERDRVLAARSAYNRALGVEDPLKELVANMLRERMGGMPAKAGADTSGAKPSGRLEKTGDGKFRFVP